MRAIFDVHAPTLDELKPTAETLAAKFFSDVEAVNFTVEPVSPAVVNERTIAGDVTFWFQEFFVDWHLKKDVVRLLGGTDD